MANRTLGFPNLLSTFISFLSNANTAARTYTFPDRDGTVALTDVSNTTITGTTTLTSADFGKLFFLGGTVADYTVNLPTAVGNTGSILYFSALTTLTKLVTLDGNSSETINGATTKVLWAGEAIGLISDGSNWSVVFIQNRPMYAAIRNTANQSGVSSATFTKVTLGTLVEDNFGTIADTANSKMTIRRAGRYRVTVTTAWSNISAANANRMIAGIYLNGSFQFGKEEAGLVGGFNVVTATRVMTLAVGDFIENYAYQNSGNSQSLFGSATNNSCFILIEEIL